MQNENNDFQHLSKHIQQFMELYDLLYSQLNIYVCIYVSFVYTPIFELTFYGKEIFILLRLFFLKLSKSHLPEFRLALMLRNVYQTFILTHDTSDL